jgi:hypothetical protein
MIEDNRAAAHIFQELMIEEEALLYLVLMIADNRAAAHIFQEPMTEEEVPLLFLVLMIEDNRTAAHIFQELMIEEEALLFLKLMLEVDRLQMIGIIRKVLRVFLVKIFWDQDLLFQVMMMVKIYINLALLVE